MWIVDEAVRSRLRLRGMVVGVFSTLVCALGLGQTPSLADILNEFQRRQSSAQVFEVRWRESVLEPGQKSQSRSMATKPTTEESHFAHQSPHQRIDVRYDRALRFVVQGERIRFEESGLNPAHGGVAFDRHAVFDGTIGIDYIAQFGDAYPLGAVAASDVTNAFEYVGARPVVLSLRGYDWISQRLTDNVSLSQTTIGDRPCLALAGLAEKLSNTSYTLWLDPVRAFTVIRMEYAQEGTLRHRIDVNYRVSEANEFVPASWVRTHWAPQGACYLVADSSITSWTINAALPASTFDLEFRPGTYVRDRRTHQAYIQLPDGKRRLILPSESGATYEQLLTTDTPHQRTFWTWLTVANLLVLGSFVGFWLLARKRVR